MSPSCLKTICLALTLACAACTATPAEVIADDGADNAALERSVLVVLQLWSAASVVDERCLQRTKVREPGMAVRVGPPGKTVPFITGHDGEVTLLAPFGSTLAVSVSGIDAYWAGETEPAAQFKVATPGSLEMRDLFYLVGACPAD